MSSGTQAAAHGGYTTVCAMPNLDPVPDSLPHLEQQLALIRRDAAIRVLPYGSITRGQLGGSCRTWRPWPPMWRPSPTTGEVCRARRRCALPWKPPRGFISSSWPTARTTPSSTAGYIHDGAYARTHGHRGICSESEWGPIAAGSGAGAPDRLRLPRLPHLHQGERGPDPPGQGGGAGRHLRDGPPLSADGRNHAAGGRPLQDESPSPQSPPTGRPCWRGWPTAPST